MTDYSTIDWSKLPELPDGLKCRLLVNELQVLKNGYVNAKRLGHDGSEWRFQCEMRCHIETAFAATDIIDRFVAEQEAEAQKPKPRRVTPKELLVELIQTGVEVAVDYEGKCTGSLTHLRWISDNEYGLQGKWSCWDRVGVKWLMGLEYIDILDVAKEPPKPRLPVKTKAPEGCRWDTNDLGGIILRRDATDDVWHLPATIGEAETKEKDAAVSLARAAAYRELNP